MNVEYKSTGVLFDEMFTADLKLEHWPDDQEVAARRHALGNAIQARLLQKSSIDSWNRFKEVWTVAKQLKDVLRECWNAQEVVMQFTRSITEHEAFTNNTLLHVVSAAVTAQRTNAQRNKLIRQIDFLLQDSENAPLRKTYSE